MNPSTYVGEPDMAPGYGTGPWALLSVIAVYAFFFWLIFKGPLRHWADENKGGASMLLMFGPLVVLAAAFLI